MADRLSLSIRRSVGCACVKIERALCRWWVNETTGCRKNKIHYWYMTLKEEKISQIFNFSNVFVPWIDDA